MSDEKMIRGSMWELMDGTVVTYVGKCGDACKVVNQAGKLEVIYPKQFRSEVTNGRRSGQSH